MESVTGHAEWAPLRSLSFAHHLTTCLLIRFWVTHDASASKGAASQPQNDHMLAPGPSHIAKYDLWLRFLRCGQASRKLEAAQASSLVEKQLVIPAIA